MNIIETIIPFIILISVIVFVHEFGHYFYAKKFGVKVTDFSIGFGKKILGWKDKSGTLWKICIFPLGGYVKFFGDTNPASFKEKKTKFLKSQEKYILETKKLYQRVIIVSAGPAANFVLAFFIFIFIFMVFGKDFSIPVIKDVRIDGPAYKAGLKINDQIISINNKKINSIAEVSQTIIIADDNLIKIKVLRNKNELTFVADANVESSKDNFGNMVNKRMIGIEIAPLNNEFIRNRLSLGDSVYNSANEIWFTVSTTMNYLFKIIKGTENANQLGGPIKIAQISGKVAKNGIAPFLSIMAYISISLGLINLFPIPLLDGGHLLFYFYEFISGKPLSYNKQVFFFKFGMVVVASLMFFATYNDLKSLGFF